MFTFPIFTLSPYSVASSSSTGAIILHGPHHSAQKSTSTGTEDLTTSSPKFVCVRVTIFAAAIRISKFPNLGSTRWLIFQKPAEINHATQCGQARDGGNPSQSPVYSVDGRD